VRHDTADRREADGDASGAAQGRDGSGHVLTRGTVVIDVEACKGCELCIHACPPGVLEMTTEVNARGYRFPFLRAGCTGCKACSQICPDFCFQVYKYETPLELPVHPANGVPGEPGGTP
jgi:2-oxoglutarate ferredoxin oxidoreductase subunit delta